MVLSSDRLVNSDERLSAFWHPVARVADIGVEPRRLTLLGQHYVVARLDGEYSIFEDRCPHRGAPLSKGRAAGNLLSCPYHGFVFNSEGNCVAAPSATTNQLAQFCLSSPHGVDVKYGLLWVAPQASSTSLPALPEGLWPIDDRTFCLVDSWSATASQIIDNFIDVTHFPFVHADTFGQKGRLDVRRLSEVDDGFECEVSARGKRLIGGGNSDDVEERILTYRYYFPFSLALTIAYPRRGIFDRIFLALQPETTQSTLVYKLVLRGEGANLSEEQAREEALLQRQITAEDKNMVQQLPLSGIDLRSYEERHVLLDEPTRLLRKVMLSKLSGGE